MSRSDWSCENRECRDPATGRRAVLGYVRNGSSLTLIASAIKGLHADQIHQQTSVVCACCGTIRVFRRGPVHLTWTVAVVQVEATNPPPPPSPIATRRDPAA